MSNNNKKTSLSKCSSKPATPLNKQRRLPTQGKPRILLEEPYILEYINDKQIRESRVMYKVQWKKFPLPGDHTWEPIENIRTCIEDIVEFEQLNVDRQLENAKINLELVEQYRENTIENEQMTQVLGFDTVNQVLFVLWTNSMVTTLHVKELDSAMIHAIACLTMPNFENRFQKNISAFTEKVQTLIQTELALPDEIKQDRNETTLPSSDDTAQLSNVLRGALLANGWPIFCVAGDCSRIMVNPKELRDRTIYGHEWIQCTLCDTCGKCFDRPNAEFFKHLGQSGHNGSYVKDYVKDDRFK